MGRISEKAGDPVGTGKRFPEANAVFKKWRNLPLRTFFVLTVLFTFAVVALLSGLIIWGCAAFRHYLLPDSDSVYLNLEKTYEDGTKTTESYLLKYGRDPEGLPEIREIASDNYGEVEREELTPKYSIEKIENSFERLTPKRKLAYRGCGIVMVIAPILLSMSGILGCSFYFYRRKLQIPLKLLSEATGQIAVQDLDFTLVYDCEDEMGELCRSFSQMQNALAENYKKLWIALEERKKLQASVAHDLRNPLAIIRGYTEYLEDKVTAGELKPEKALRIVQNLNAAAIRMEQYTESIRTLSQLEDVEPDRQTVSASGLAAALAMDFGLLARQRDRCLLVSSNGSNAAVSPEQSREILAQSKIPILPDVPILADTAVIYRVLENVIGNSLRFSEKEVFLDFSLDAKLLCITVQDDGKGFPSENESRDMGASGYTQNPKDGHMGIGLAVSRILCQKHGGTLTLSNASSGGAVVKITFEV